MLTHSPKIITDGLGLYLDAGNVRSYPGSGSSWNDLSGLGFHASMFGSVPFETDIAQCFNFATATGASSSSSSLGFTFTSNMVPRTGDFTISCWVKNPNATVNQTGLFSNAGGGDGFRFGIGLNGVYTLVGPTYSEATTTFISSLSNSLWYYVTTVFNRTLSQILVYLNGVFQNSRSLPASQTQMQNSAPGLVRSPCCHIYTGKLAQFMVYNRALSDIETMQNFNTLRGRYGV